MAAPGSALRAKWRIATLAIVVSIAACGQATEPSGESGESTSIAATTSPPTTAIAASPTTVAATAPPVSDGCAHVIDGAIEWQGATATVSATVRSADTGWDKYADAWEVRTPTGVVLGVRELAHPHENEQPFTRSLSGVEIPAEATEVVLAARDSVEGWCGDVFAVAVPSPP